MQPIPVGVRSTRASRHSGFMTQRTGAIHSRFTPHFEGIGRGELNAVGVVKRRKTDSVKLRGPTGLIGPHGPRQPLQSEVQSIPYEPPNPQLATATDILSIHLLAERFTRGWGADLSPTIFNPPRRPGSRFAQGLQGVPSFLTCRGLQPLRAKADASYGVESRADDVVWLAQLRRWMGAHGVVCAHHFYTPYFASVYIILPLLAMTDALQASATKDKTGI
ncbi:uncharacterized protein N7482_002169 [Penicillium canariense]|uniref:Uncharacterized protein n=1 Tax=Penicillium canariense TaxID=189055 RepID=A0A9W9IH58_9EURO|nr:uncharacterized protein N7482_002169 [Penicillium canariense]KAJ5176292.1 hypothetical protein N7482_002169 [Penicillium canariense]